MRVTPQRARIWGELSNSGEHLTVDELWGRAQRGLPGLELSTVYRSLEVLQAAGLVAESRMPEGPRVFEARRTVHPHLICERCGGIFHAEPGVEARLLEELGTGSGGFEVCELHAVAKGVCAGCAGREKGGL